MLLGPVFRAELLRTSRRRVFYTLRVIYGIVLLMVVWLNYERLLVILEIRGGRGLIKDVAEFALNTFTWFAAVQLVTLLILVPTLFGGIIADEKQRKTMHYLMASRLSSGEIVLDKLGARLLHVGVFILLGIPVMSLLTLFGGVAWDYVVGAYAATLSITFFAAALAVLISTFARRVGQGVLIAYLLEIGWLILPPLIDAVCRGFFWLVGLAAGAIHPLGLLLAVLVVSLLTAFVVALGTFASLTARKTGRALTAIIASLLLLNVGYIAIVYPLILVFGDPYASSHRLGIGFTPLWPSVTLLSYRRVPVLFDALSRPGDWPGIDVRAIVYGVLLLLAYAIATAILFWWSLRRFEQLVDRPRRRH